MLLLFLSVLIAKENHEAFKGLRFMLVPESISSVEGAAIIISMAICCVNLRYVE